ncbi:hypothetical protein PR048_029083 [Dryococelus australis]|uniref:Uncharacterized protein n=1 Tax=Dryococelus australis TaxID=614101 RepID=A0ABQ9GF04_9NEOP|nr:hypothetical protein PR048_029083 [Dryococelus australis]
MYDNLSATRHTAAIVAHDLSSVDFTIARSCRVYCHLSPTGEMRTIRSTYKWPAPRQAKQGFTNVLSNFIIVNAPLVFRRFGHGFSAGKKERGETGDPRENPPTNGSIRHDSHMRKSGVNRPGIKPGSPWWEASRLTAQPRGPLLLSAAPYSTHCTLIGSQYIDVNEPSKPPRSTRKQHEPPAAISKTSNTRTLPGTEIDKIDIKYVYTEVDFAVGSQFIRHALDDSEPIADLQGNK